jgi:CheY-like chemotaxis protein/cell division protein FtsB
MKTVLVADNDAFQRQLVDMLLAVDNYKIIGFDTGRKVLEYLQSHVPDIAILDYNLPDINGADLCAKIRGVKRLSKVPVILVTSTHKLPLVKGIAVAVKANGILSKPLGDKKLLEHVRTLLASSKPKQVLSGATPINLNPILEQALDHLPYLTQSHESLSAVPTNIEPTESFDQLANLEDHLPPLDIADLIDTQPLQDTATPQLFQSDTAQPTPLPDQQDYKLPPLDIFDDEESGSISEQELLDSLKVELDESLVLPERPNFQESSFDEPQVYRLPHLDISDTPVKVPSSITTYDQRDTLQEQLEQLSSENEQLKTTLRELDSGHPLHASHSYLNAIEELEMLRRLTTIQTKQLNELQKHNESLLDEIQLLKSQRRSSFFGFRSGKKLDRDSV